MSTPRSGRVPAIEPEEAKVLLNGDALMIDVRDEHEWAAGHAPHSVHIPLDDVSSSTPYTTRTRRVIVVSRSGRRAESAVIHLRTAGVDAVALRGGLRAWVEAGGGLVGDGGHGPHIAAPRHAEGGGAAR